jgi:hypothetical protein
MYMTVTIPMSLQENDSYDLQHIKLGFRQGGLLSKTWEAKQRSSEARIRLERPGALGLQVNYTDLRLGFHEIFMGFFMFFFSLSMGYIR